jgi:hypothetical protein
VKSTQKGGENNENYENNEKCGVYSGHCDVYHLAGSGTFIGNNNKNSKWVQLYVRIKNFSLGIRSAEDPRFGVYQRWKL